MTIKVVPSWETQGRPSADEFNLIANGQTDKREEGKEIACK